MSSHISPPNCCLKTQPMSLEPYMLMRLLTARSDTAALNRFVWPMIQDVM